MNPSVAPRDAERAAMAHFHALDQVQQADAIRRLAAAGMSDHGIARATRLAVEQIRRVLGEHTSCKSVASA